MKWMSDSQVVYWMYKFNKMLEQHGYKFSDFINAYNYFKTPIRHRVTISPQDFKDMLKTFDSK